MPLKSEIWNLKSAWRRGRANGLGILHGIWQWLREVSGDAAYEKYLRSRQRCGAPSACGGQATLSREEFYLDSLRRRYSGVSRCC